MTFARGIAELLQLERAVLDARERECRSIGGDLHGRLGQELPGLGLLLAVVERSLGDSAPQAHAALLRSQDVLRHAMAATRRLARALTPVDVEEVGCRRRSRRSSNTPRPYSASRTTWMRPHDWSPGRSDSRCAISRIARKAIGNAARHGKATPIEVRLTGAPEPYLEIADDGTGFDAAGPQAPAGMRLGLMRYRATTIGGLLSVDSDGAGTRIRCQVPDGPRPK